MNYQPIEEWLQDFSGEVALSVGTAKEIEFSYHENQSFLAASMIKLFILWELFRQREQESLDLQKRVPLNKESMVPGFGVLCRLQEGLQPTLRDLATLMIIVSDNTATNQLMDILGIDQIQKTCQSMGWNQTQIQRKMFDSEAEKRGLENRTSSRDLANFFQRLLGESKELNRETKNEMLEILANQQCNNKLSGRIFNQPDGTRIQMAHKTGDISYHEHDGGIFYTPQGEKVVVLLTGNLKSNWDGVHLHQKIGEYLWNQWK